MPEAQEQTHPDDEFSHHNPPISPANICRTLGECGAMAHEKASRGNPFRAVGVLSRCAAKQRCPVVSQVKRQNQAGKCHLSGVVCSCRKAHILFE